MFMSGIFHFTAKNIARIIYIVKNNSGIDKPENLIPQLYFMPSKANRSVIQQQLSTVNYSAWQTRDI